jgi:hypothetical protein
MGISINSVIPAKAGIQVLQAADMERNLDSRSVTKKIAGMTAIMGL